MLNNYYKSAFRFAASIRICETCIENRRFGKELKKKLNICPKPTKFNL